MIFVMNMARIPSPCRISCAIAAIPWTPTVIASLFIYAYFVVAFVSALNTFAQLREAAEVRVVLDLQVGAGHHNAKAVIQLLAHQLYGIEHHAGRTFIRGVQAPPRPRDNGDMPSPSRPANQSSKGYPLSTISRQTFRMCSASLVSRVRVTVQELTSVFASSLSW